MKVEIFTDYRSGSTPGSVTIPYKGVEISVSTFGEHGEVAVFNSREDRSALQVFHGATADSIKDAFIFVDKLKTGRNRYTQVDETMCDLMTIKQYIQAVRDGMILDSDGHGHPVGFARLEDNDTFINPSAKGDDIPDATLFIAWYNK